MIGRTNALAGGVSANGMPKITFNGKWLPWRLEFYGGVLYWEAWFLSSGTLTANKSYVADVWGIGGGATGYWTAGSRYGCSLGGGRTGLRTGISLAGSIAVTIGAGANAATSMNAQGNSGGATKIGDTIIGDGGTITSSPISANKRYRFEDPDKASEAGAGASDKNFEYGGGWLPIAHGGNPNMDDYRQTQGFGGAGAPYTTAWQGALVIRIPA